MLIYSGEECHHALGVRGLDAYEIFNVKETTNTKIPGRERGEGEEKRGREGEREREGGRGGEGEREREREGEKEDERREVK